MSHSADRLISVERTIRINDVRLGVAIADTPDELSRGLGGVTALKPDEGMLFIYRKDDQYSLWMLDMRIPIDMLWISSDKRVVHIEKDVSPDSFPQAFTPASQSRYTLEVPAGFVTEHKIEIGSKLEW